MYNLNFFFNRYTTGIRKTFHRYIFRSKVWFLFNTHKSDDCLRVLIIFPGNIFSLNVTGPSKSDYSRTRTIGGRSVSRGQSIGTTKRNLPGKTARSRSPIIASEPFTGVSVTPRGCQLWETKSQDRGEHTIERPSDTKRFTITRAAKNVRYNLFALRGPTMGGFFFYSRKFGERTDITLARGTFECARLTPPNFPSIGGRKYGKEINLVPLVIFLLLLHREKENYADALDC